MRERERETTHRDKKKKLWKEQKEKAIMTEAVTKNQMILDWD